MQKIGSTMKNPITSVMPLKNTCCITGADEEVGNFIPKAMQIQTHAHIQNIQIPHVTAKRRSRVFSMAERSAISFSAASLGTKRTGRGAEANNDQKNLPIKVEHTPQTRLRMRLSM